MDFKDIVSFTSDKLSNLIHQIGNTPMQPVDLVVGERAHTIYLKLESANPTGSMKDRTGFALIKYLEDQDILNGESIIIESTSGNLGVALALFCKVKGYNFLAVVDLKTTQENIWKMQSAGAQIAMIDQSDEGGGYLLSRLAYVQKQCHQSSRYVWTNQYENSANPLIHYTDTGPEIYNQMNGKVDAIFVPVSTGGTIAGIGRFFRKVSPSTHIIGVDAYGSVVFGTPPASRKLTGIGSSRPSSFISKSLCDAHILVRDEEAFAFCRALYITTGMKLGGSSGAVLAACIRYLSTYPDSTRVVCVCADTGENYNSSIFNDEWITQQGLDLQKEKLEALQQSACEILRPR